MWLKNRVKNGLKSCSACPVSGLVETKTGFEVILQVCAARTEHNILTSGYVSAKAEVSDPPVVHTSPQPKQKTHIKMNVSMCGFGLNEA